MILKICCPISELPPGKKVPFTSAGYYIWVSTNQSDHSTGCFNFITLEGRSFLVTNDCHIQYSMFFILSLASVYSTKPEAMLHNMPSLHTQLQQSETYLSLARYSL